MSTVSTLSSKAADEVVDADGFAHPIGRKLRTFDVGGIPPYEYPGVVQFLKAAKLTDLTADEIRAFLLLRDNPDPRGCTRDDVAWTLDASPRKATVWLEELQRKGYVRHSSVQRADDRGEPIVAWVVDGANGWSNPDVLFWEFGYLMDTDCDCCG